MNENAECRQCQEWIDDAFSDELGAELRPALQAHLDSCTECRALWEDTLTLQRGMALIAETDGPSLKSQNAVLRAAEGRAEKRRAKSAGLWSWLLRPATVAFATLALVAGLGILGKQELQKKKAAEQQMTSPILAPQGTPMEAPPAGGRAAPAPDAGSGATVKAPETKAKAKPRVEEARPAANEPKVESQTFKKDEVRRKEPADLPSQAAPASLGILKESDSAQPVAPAKSLAKPMPPPPPAADLIAPAPVQGSSVPEAEKGTGGTPREAVPEFRQNKQPENFQAPIEGSLGASRPGSGGKNLERATSDDLDQAKDKEPANRFQTLLNSAKLKIRQKNYPAALEDLLAAQRIQDSKEVQDLILLCRSHLRGDG